MKRQASALYRGKVTHTRLEPMRHRFEYKVFYGLFDIDELDLLDRSSRFFSVGRFNLLGLNPQDHGPTGDGSLRSRAEDLFRQAGVDLEGGRLTLLAFPRVLGYAFNPISVWYGYGPNGLLRGVIHEVRNTFGDRHFYVAELDPADLRHRTLKRMHVSPFNGLAQTYEFTINDPSDHLALAIVQADSEGTMFRAGLRLSRVPFTDGNVIRLSLGHPLLTLKVIFGIHWEALKLWMKGGTYHKRPDPPINNITVMTERKVAR